MMWRLWIIALVLSCECLVSAQQYYEPVWSGKRCREDETVDVGRGAGSCNSDCDCPLCAPYCSTSGYCQNHQRAGRRKCSPATASASTGSASACPPLLGDPAPPGCNKTFVEDSYGGIPCQDNNDCPQSKAWYCDEWKPDIPDACHTSLPVDVTLSRCQEDRCTFVADWYWGWCLDTDTNTLRIVDIRTDEIKEYSCRGDGDCLNIQYDIQNDFKCQNGRCIARNADRHWRLIDDSDPKYSEWLKTVSQTDPVYENIECNDATARCPGIIRTCGFQGGMGTISIGRSPAYTSPISAQSTRRNSCSYCSKTTCPPSRPCRRGGRCYDPTCNRRGRCWCKK